MSSGSSQIVQFGNARAHVGAYATALYRDADGWIAGAPVVTLEKTSEDDRQKKVISLNCFEVAGNTACLKELLEAAPGSAPSAADLCLGLKAADALLDYKLSGTSRLSPLWCRDEAEKIHMLWSFVWSCYCRSPTRSKSVNMQRLKFILENGGAEVPARSSSGLQDS